MYISLVYISLTACINNVCLLFQTPNISHLETTPLLFNTLFGNWNRVDIQKNILWLNELLYSNYLTNIPILGKSTQINNLEEQKCYIIILSNNYWHLQYIALHGWTHLILKTDLSRTFHFVFKTQVSWKSGKLNKYVQSHTTIKRLCQKRRFNLLNFKVPSLKYQYIALHCKTFMVGLFIKIKTQII